MKEKERIHLMSKRKAEKEIVDIIEIIQSFSAEIIIIIANFLILTANIVKLKLKFKFF